MTLQTPSDLCTIEIRLTRIPDPAQLFGSHDTHLILLEKAFDVTIAAHQNALDVTGSAAAVEQVRMIIQDLEKLASAGYGLTRDEFQTAIRAFQARPAGESNIRELLLNGSIITTRTRKVFPKTPQQKAYIDAITHNDLTFAIGPAGTGKTYLAVAMAVSYLLTKKVSRIILARPAVEAGESLGFLPGDMVQKVNPYLRPLYDALFELLELDRAQRLVEKGVIEVAPIAFMRGRTLNEAFIILDEAQNTTPEQMKMFLTRLGYNSKTVVTGDITQIDLPRDRRSGLVHVQSILHSVPNIRFLYLTERDVVRCDLVRAIVSAYEAGERTELERRTPHRSNQIVK